MSHSHQPLPQVLLGNRQLRRQVIRSRTTAHVFMLFCKRRLRQHVKKGCRLITCNPSFFWWASLESNKAPTDYESAALTKHELEARNCCMHHSPHSNRREIQRRAPKNLPLDPCCISCLRGSSSACRSATDGAACAAPSLRSGGYARA